MPITRIAMGKNADNENSYGEKCRNLDSMKVIIQYVRRRDFLYYFSTSYSKKHRFLPAGPKVVLLFRAPNRENCIFSSKKIVDAQRE